MRSLRCLLGIHRTEWVSSLAYTHAADPAAVRGWLQVRRCRDCKQPVGRQHQ